MVITWVITSPHQIPDQLSNSSQTIGAFLQGSQWDICLSVKGRPLLLW